MTITNLPAITPSITDAGIIEAIRQKKAEGMSILYDRYNIAVYQMLRQVCPAYAQDILQEVFLHAWKCINDYPSGRRSLLSWLLTIALDLGQEKDKDTYLNACTYYSKIFYPRAYDILKNSKAAQEILQEIMQEAWDTLALHNSSNASSLLFKGLKDKARRWLEDKEREKIVNTSQEVAVTHIAGVPIDAMRQSLQAIVQALSPEALDIITAVFIESHPVDKVARDRNITTGEVFQYTVSVCKLLSKILNTEKP